jgi:hypothetical protein
MNLLYPTGRCRGGLVPRAVGEHLVGQFGAYRTLDKDGHVGVHSGVGEAGAYSKVRRTWSSLSWSPQA